MNIEEINYQNDYRVKAIGANSRTPWFAQVDEHRLIGYMDSDFYFENCCGDEDPEEVAARLVDCELPTVPMKYEVCPTCNGRGSHVNPSIDASGLTNEDFADDPEFAESYRAGAYDVPCYECGGRRVALEIDREKCPKLIIDGIDNWLADEAAYQTMCRAESAMGA